MKFTPTLAVLLLLAVVHLWSAPSASATPAIVISVADQKLALLENGLTVAKFSVSTSKFGLGDRSGSYATPTGLLAIAAKIGENARAGAVFKSRHLTGEILPPNARGRDPIVTRILWLRGLEKGNARAYERGIYIHGTPVEKLIGRPASYGCVRMRSRDIVRLFGSVNVGTRLFIDTKSLPQAIARAAATLSGPRLASAHGSASLRGQIQN